MDEVPGTARPEALPPGFGAMWRSQEPVRRGPRPGLTVEGIVAAAIALADAEGLSAVSMARVAEALGVTTMALYRYVGGKDELLAAMYDAATGYPPDLTELHDAGGWRPALAEWCRAQLRLALAHPWIGEATLPAAFGPGRLAWLEAGLAATEGTALTLHERTAVVGRLSLHMLGELQLVAASVRAAPEDETTHPALLDYPTLLRRLVDPARHPSVMAALAVGAFDDDDAAEQGDEAVDFGLDLLLDGVAALVARAEQREAAGRRGGAG